MDALKIQIPVVSRTIIIEATEYGRVSGLTYFLAREADREFLGTRYWTFLRLLRDEGDVYLARSYGPFCGYDVSPYSAPIVHPQSPRAIYVPSRNIQAAVRWTD